MAAVGYPEKMRDANGAVHTYTEPPHTGRTGPKSKTPKYPHPDAILQVHDSGRGIHPCTHRTPSVHRYLAYCEQEGVEPDMPISGDETARLAVWQCWDDLTGRLQQKTYTGTEPCEEPTCPHPRPHTASSWIHASPWEPDRDPRHGTPYYRDIAHVLYPSGMLPTPVRDEHELEPKPDDPVQLTIYDALEAMTP